MSCLTSGLMRPHLHRLDLHCLLTPPRICTRFSMRPRSIAWLTLAQWKTLCSPGPCRSELQLRRPARHSASMIISTLCGRVSICYMRRRRGVALGPVGRSTTGHTAIQLRREGQMRLRAVLHTTGTLYMHPPVHSAAFAPTDTRHPATEQRHVACRRL